MTGPRATFLGRFLASALARLGSYRAWRLYRAAVDSNPAAVRDVLQYVLREELPEARLEPAFARMYANEVDPRLAAVLTLGVADPAADRRLDAIPSEATRSDRRLLYLYFRTFWSGQQNVLEIGPYLGGTTRAIAMGMEANPRRRDGVKLYTYDRFRNYAKPDALRAQLSPLVQQGLLSEADLQTIGEKGSFRAVFDLLHRRESYYSLLAVRDEGVPDLPGDPEFQDATLTLPASEPFDSFFVDGCKSWYGTKRFMIEACAKAQPGSVFLFQDYGLWTCFWVASFLYRLRARFVLFAYVDDTYGFQLQSALPAAAIESAFPDAPSALAPADFESMFGELTEAALARKDRRMAVGHQLHLAAALATIGQVDAGRGVIDDLWKKPFVVGYEKRVDAAKAYLTYYPSLENGEKKWHVVTF